MKGVKGGKCLYDYAARQLYVRKRGKKFFF